MAEERKIVLNCRKQRYWDNPENREIKIKKGKKSMLLMQNIERE